MEGHGGVSSRGREWGGRGVCGKTGNGAMILDAAAANGKGVTKVVVGE